MYLCYCYKVVQKIMKYLWWLFRWSLKNLTDDIMLLDVLQASQIWCLETSPKIFGQQGNKYDIYSRYFVSMLHKLSNFNARVNKADTYPQIRLHWVISFCENIPHLPAPIISHTSRLLCSGSASPTSLFLKTYQNWLIENHISQKSAWQVNQMERRDYISPWCR